MRPYTAGHRNRVSEYAAAIASADGFAGRCVIRVAAQMHAPENWNPYAVLEQAPGAGKIRPAEQPDPRRNSGAC
jgi:hypothetical protein